MLDREKIQFGSGTDFCGIYVMAILTLQADNFKKVPFLFNILSKNSTDYIRTLHSISDIHTCEYICISLNSLRKTTKLKKIQA